MKKTPSIESAEHELKAGLLDLLHVKSGGSSSEQVVAILNITDLVIARLNQNLEAAASADDLFGVTRELASIVSSESQNPDVVANVMALCAVFLMQVQRALLEDTAASSGASKIGRPRKLHSAAEFNPAVLAEYESAIKRVLKDYNATAEFVVDPSVKLQKAGLLSAALKERLRSEVFAEVAAKRSGKRSPRGPKLSHLKTERACAVKAFCNVFTGLVSKRSAGSVFAWSSDKFDKHRKSKV